MKMEMIITNKFPEAAYGGEERGRYKSQLQMEQSKNGID